MSEKGMPTWPLIAANANFTTLGVDAPYEREALQKVRQACRDLLIALGIDVDNDSNVRDTPQRMARMYLDELLRGRYVAKPDLREFPNQRGLDQLYLVGPVSITSLCSHHFLPFVGECYIGILPGKDQPVLGLSKFARLAHWIFARPQIQEEATIQLADEIEQACHPQGLGVVVKAEHQCMTIRGVREPGAKMTTSVMRGVLREDARARDEFFQLMKTAEK